MKKINSFVFKSEQNQSAKSMAALNSHLIYVFIVYFVNLNIKLVTGIFQSITGK